MCAHLDEAITPTSLWLSCHRRWPQWKADAKSTFLQGGETPKSRDIFLQPVAELAAGLQMPPNGVARMLKAAYGLSALREWYLDIDKTKISWQAQRFVNLEVQISRQAQHFVLSEAHLSLSLILAHAHTHNRSHSHPVPTLAHSHTHTHSLTHSLTHTHSHTLTLTLTTTATITTISTFITPMRLDL